MRNGDLGNLSPAMQSVLVNVGDPSPCPSLDEWQILWIREEPRFRALGVPRHRDPEFETFTYGDYPWKPAKANLAKMGVGDWIFFNETLVVAGAKLRYVIAAFNIAERISYEQLAERELLDDPRYVGNAHVRRNALVPASDTRFAIWRGGPGSRLLARPMLMDRAFMEELALPAQDGGPWDWDQRARNGKAFTELQLIGFHTRATRRLDEQQTRWLLGLIERLPTRVALI
ncbi:MAG: Nmad3 protein [Chloroflexi bacterium]|nr:Nmad3 protein [Chloroflexota bacterium]